MRDAINLTLANVTLYLALGLFAFVAGRQIVGAATRAVLEGLPW
ncbi:MAG TPA: hypothetical protein VM285_06205 [Polyangia bacterium]|nr:hypothetical protein [Polyangia bacterium]